MTKSLFALLTTAFGVALIQSTSANPPDNLINRCGQEQGLLPWKYCVSTTPGSLNHDVVYYFHGGPGDEYEWIKFAQETRDQWKKLKAHAPVVVTVSFGPEWLLLDRTISARTGQFEAFFGSALPFIEKQILHGHIGRRWVVGLSMGGFSAAQVLTKTPQLVAGAALICPMFVDLPPDATDAEYREWVRRSRVPQYDPRPLLARIRGVIPDRAGWSRSSPFFLAQKNLGPSSPPLFLTYGTSDGFIDGILEFEAIARNRHANITSSPVAGPHCVYDPAGLALFLLGKPLNQ